MATSLRKVVVSSFLIIVLYTALIILFTEGSAYAQDMMDKLIIDQVKAQIELIKGQLELIRWASVAVISALAGTTCYLFKCVIDGHRDHVALLKETAQLREVNATEVTQTLVKVTEQLKKFSDSISKLDDSINQLVLESRELMGMKKVCSS